MPGTPKMPSLKILLDQVASERATVSARADSLDTRAGVVLGFAGVLVGLGATASSMAIFTNGYFQAGLGVAVVAALSAAFAFVPRNSPVLDMRPARDRYLTADESVTELILLDTQIEVIKTAAELVKQKGRRLQVSVVCLAIAAILVVVGTLTSGG
jgi:cytochrome c biogenesis protein CcdA